MPQAKRFDQFFGFTLAEHELSDLRKLSAALDLSLAETCRRCLRIGTRELAVRRVLEGSVPGKSYDVQESKA